MDTHKKSFVIGIMLIIILLLIIALAYVGLKKLNPVGPTISTNPIATSTVATSTPDNVPADWKTYVNNDFKYQFRYPPTITYSKSLTTSAPDGNSSITYPANEPINVLVTDISRSAGAPAGSKISIIPLYVEVNVILKPAGYSTLSKFVAGEVQTAINQGENSAAGVYADSNPVTINGLNGFLVVVSDGSVVKNRDDKYYFDYGSYIYTFDMAYSGYYYETKDKDEVSRVDTAKAILSTFRFIQ